ncbi:MAG TPA: MFS transporter, partial [Roseateles sp.]
DPAHHWPEPALAAPVAADRGPVLVLVTYRIDAADRPAALALLRQLSLHRRGDGASGWGLTEDTADPTQLVEWFLLPSWQEHLRQHHRASHAAAVLQAQLRRIHRAPEPPAVHHLLTLAGATP